ncbi:MAG: cupin domain-containing protein [Deltaproteobacteria bacterium]|nr:cupin domain-containing protein [Deltaproteobacteria bacterium]MCB9785868.1 cupin domain-containing protein [Deltaproteobacteria bacterium]
MARLIPLWTGRPLDDPTAIAEFLAPRGVAFARWEVGSEATALAAREALDDDARERLVALFRLELARLADAEGYPAADVVAVRAVPGVDEALARFDRVHFHDDDEVRAIVGGRGAFGFVGDDGRQFLLEVEAGDFISVPAGMWHWFYCDDERTITAIRLFRDSAGWTPHYRSTERGVPAVHG